MQRAICLLLCALALGAEQRPYRWYTTDDGLVRNTITRIRRDPRGFLWICTVEGLSLFDGFQFINYTVGDGLPDRRVYDILSSRDGTYWIATSGGLYRFRPRRALASGQNQKPVFEPVSRLDGGPGPALRMLLMDSRGTIWAGGFGGLFRLRPDSTGLEAVAMSPQGLVLSLYQDAKERVWIGSVQGLYRFSESSGVATRVYMAGDVSSIHMDRKGRLWIGEYGLTRLDADQDPPVKVEHFGAETSDAFGTRVFDIRESADGEFWIGAKGLVHFLPEGPTPRARKFRFSAEWEDQFVYAVEIGVGGDLWAGVGRLGLVTAPRTPLRVFTDADGLPSTKVMGMLPDQPAPLVITLDRSYSWNEFDGQRFHRIAPALPPSVLGMGWAVGKIVLQDRDREWWVPSAFGLLHYPAAERATQLSGVLPKEVLTAKDGILDKLVLSVFEDSRGDLWVGTVGGVAWRERSTGKWHSGVSMELVGRNTAVETMVEDRSGTVWLGLEDAIARFRGGKFEVLTRGIPRGINCLFVDSKGRLWIAASQEGLARIDRPEDAEPAVRRYGVADGISSADLSSIGEDLYGKIYIAGGRGVDRLDPDSGYVKHIGPDGIKGEPELVFRDRSGAMWFASVYGLARYEPAAEDRVVAPPDPLFRSVRVAGKRLMVSDLGESTLSLSLRPGETGLDIELGAVRLGAGEKFRYQYWLEGAEKDRSPPVDTPFISLAGLSPGTYRLLVRTVDDAGVTSARYASMDFEAIPQLWQRAWFRLLLVAVVLVSAVSFHMLRVRRLLEMERIRSRIAADLHDDIGASLAQVAVLSEVANRHAYDAVKVRSQTEKIASISRELVGSMSDIVWSISPTHDSLDDLIRRMREFAEEVLTARDIQLGFEVSNANENVRLGIEVRRHFFLIFKEAVHNAARHSGCSRVDVGLSVEGRWLDLSISDDGRGLDAGKSNGHGLANMRRRAEGMRGVFEVREGLLKGASIRVRIPIDS
jgi:ligand-binding sensor domain-containing protein/two-component sensor histidine kinase